MAELAEIVRRFAGHDGVTGAAVVSPDGLPIDHAGTIPDPDALAALTVTLLRPSARLGRASRRRRGAGERTRTSGA